LGFALARLGRQRRRSIRDAPSRRLGFAAAQLLVLGASIGTTDLLAGLAGTFGEPLTPFMVLTPICLAFIVIGGLIGRVPPNAFVGLRTPWALNSRLAWDRSNRLSGRLLLLTGCLALATTPGSSMSATVGVLAAGGLLAVIHGTYESWRVWRTDPRR
jgi:hypothetical protein